MFELESEKNRPHYPTPNITFVIFFNHYSYVENSMLLVPRNRGPKGCWKLMRARDASSFEFFESRFPGFGTRISKNSKRSCMIFFLTQYLPSGDQTSSNRLIPEIPESNSGNESFKCCAITFDVLTLPRSNSCRVSTLFKLFARILKKVD